MNFIVCRGQSAPGKSKITSQFKVMSNAQIPCIPHFVISSSHIMAKLSCLLSILASVFW